MFFFTDRIILPILAEYNLSRILEIGASTGKTTSRLITLPNVDVSVVDPCLDLDLAAKFGNQIELYRGLSLEALENLDGNFDCILIDGDHNYYTVYNEMRLIFQLSLLKPGGLIFFHDTCWPYGRRDMYYDPETIPDNHRQPYSTGGIVRGRSELLESGGFNKGHFNASREGGPRNGVLTAIEDFIAESKTPMKLVVDPREWGLGVVIPNTSSRSHDLLRSIRKRIFADRFLSPIRNRTAGAVYDFKQSKFASKIRFVKNSIFRHHS